MFFSWHLYRLLNNIIIAKSCLCIVLVNSFWLHSVYIALSKTCLVNSRLMKSSSTLLFKLQIQFHFEMHDIAEVIWVAQCNSHIWNASYTCIWNRAIVCVRVSETTASLCLGGKLQVFYGLTWLSIQHCFLLTKEVGEWSKHAVSNALCCFVV